MATSSVTSSTGTNGSTISTDVYNRVMQTMSSQNGAATKLNAALTRDQTRLSGLGQLQSALASFQSVAGGLTGAGLSTSAASSSQSVATASSTGAAKAGAYALEVLQLAQGQFLTSDAFPAANAAIGSGASTTVKIDFGTDGDKGFVNGSAASKSITIDSSNNTLDGIAAAFKAAGVDVSVVKGDDGKYSLAIHGDTGAANSMRISVSGDAALKNLLSYDPDGAQKLKQGATAQDAIFTVNGGQSITSASNTVKDSAIAGATLNLAGAGKTTISITQDPSQIGANLKAFVSAYNGLNAKLQQLQQGDLKSDTAINQVVSQMSLLVKTAGGVSMSALKNAGVSQDAKGNLVVDDKKLQAALASDSSAVAKLFTNNGSGLADKLAAKAAAFTGDSGIISRETSQASTDLAAVNAKRAALNKALTAQASALASLYATQAQTGAGSAVNGSSSGTGTLFDILG